MKKLYGIVILTAMITFGNGCSNSNKSSPTGPGGSSISGTFTGIQSGQFVAVSDIDVPVGTTLTLQPGTTIKFQPGVKLTVHGTINAVADSLHMITFTSALTQASPGDWEGIYLYPNITDTSVFKGCLFAYGNRFDNAYEQDTSITSNNTPGGVYKGMISVNGAMVKLDRCILYKGGWEGVEVQGTNGIAVISFCDLYKTSNSGLSVRLGGRIQVSNTNIISSFDCGLIVHDEYGGGTFTGGYNNVWDNRSANYRRKPSGLLLPLNGDLSGDPAFQDGENMNFHITPASTIIDQGDPDASLHDPDGTRADIGVYFFRQSANILFGAIRGSLPRDTYTIVWDCYVNAGDSLILAPGTTIKFAGYYSLTINGILMAVGTATDTITFTSNADLPAIGDWKNVYLNGNTTNGSRLAYCKFRYGSKYDPSGDEATGAISVTAARVDISHVLITDTYNDGIHLADGCSGTVQDVNIYNFGSYGIRCILNVTTSFRRIVIANGLGDGVSIESNSSPTFTNVLITDNGVSGIVMDQLCSPTFNFVTIANNFFDGLTLRQNSLPSIRNSIIALNGRYGVDQQESSIATHDHNLYWTSSSDTTLLFVNIENLIDRHPVSLDASERVADPQFHGTGTTLERYRLLDNSPAKNAATDGTELGAFGGQGMGQ